LGEAIYKNKMGGKCSTYVEKRGEYKVLVGEPRGEKSLVRPRRRCKYNIKMNLQEVCWGLD
jgi:hypothetical protein